MGYAKTYNRFKKQLALATHNLGTPTGGAYKVMLVNGYTFDADHTALSSLTASEISGTGYASGFAGAGRKTVASPTVTEDMTNDRIVWKFTSVTWTGLNAGTFDAMVLFWQPTAATVDADCTPMAYYYVGGVLTSGNDEQLVIDATEGALQIL